MATRANVALDQLSLPARLHATKLPDGLEDDQDALRVAGQVAQLHIALGDHDLEDKAADQCVGQGSTGAMP